MSILKVVAILLAIYSLHDVIKTVLSLIPNRKLFRLALKHQAKDAAEIILLLTANILAIAIFFIFAIG